MLCAREVVLHGAPSNPVEQHQNDDDQENRAEAADAMVAVTIAVASEASAEPSHEEDHEDDDQDQAQRHLMYPSSGSARLHCTLTPCWQRGDRIPLMPTPEPCTPCWRWEPVALFPREPMRSLLLWLIGIPIPIIIILWLITGHA